MLIDAHLASLILKIPIPTSSISVPQGRKLIILRAKQYYERFLRLCDSYDLIVKKEDQALYEALVVEQAGSADVALRGGLQGDPGQKREAKIRRYREEKELKATLEVRVLATFSVQTPAYGRK